VNVLTTSLFLLSRETIYLIRHARRRAFDYLEETTPRPPKLA
jgi:hypothetical protein